MTKVTLQADIWEISRYTYEIDVDDSKSKEEQAVEAIEKFKAFKNENCSYPLQKEPIGGVLCIDRESNMSEGNVEGIYCNID